MSSFVYAHENIKTINKWQKALKIKGLKEAILIPATIKDIAKACGTSEGTVDRALNNRGGIKKETKEKILQVAKELDYRPNHLASCLAKGSTKTIGVVCAGLRNAFFSSLVEEIERTAHENGYFITLILTYNSRDKELEGIRFLAERQVDGIIIFPIGQGPELEKELLKTKLPIVTVYNRISEKFVHVDVDGRQIMRSAVSQIVEKGYRRIAYLDLGHDVMEDEGKNRYSLNQRRQGYLDGVEDERLEAVIYSEFKEEELLEFINREGGKPAILCPFDNVAIRTLNIMRKNGISVPGQVGIMGFDNIPILDSITPRLYSVDCGMRTLGRKTVSILLRRIDGDTDVSDCVTGYTFIEGESL